MHPVQTEREARRATETRPAPAAGLGLLVATSVSVVCVLMGYGESHTGGCDSGLCGIPALLGWVAAVVSWPVVFGLVFGLVRLANRRP